MGSWTLQGGVRGMGARKSPRVVKSAFWEGRSRSASVASRGESQTGGVSQESGGLSRYPSDFLKHNQRNYSKLVFQF